MTYVNTETKGNIWHMETLKPKEIDKQEIYIGLNLRISLSK